MTEHRAFRPLTGNDIVKALTESGLLDKELERFEYDFSYGLKSQTKDWKTTK